MVFGSIDISYWCLAGNRRESMGMDGNGWEWMGMDGNEIIIDTYCGSFPGSLLSTSKIWPTFPHDGCRGAHPEGTAQVGDDDGHLHAPHGG